MPKSKIGRRFLRKALYMPAMLNPLQDSMGKNLPTLFEHRRETSMLIIAAMMRKLIHVAFGVLKSKTPFDYTSHRG
jgi:hypothetical protein